jgi:type 1 glutamine amidotransferase
MGDYDVAVIGTGADPAQQDNTGFPMAYRHGVAFDRMDHPEYPDTPVSWVTEYGDGRVFFASSGHGEPALTNESAGELLREGTRWAAGDAP